MVGFPNCTGDRNSCTLDPSGPHPLYLFIWLFIGILYNKSEMVSKLLSEFCESFCQIAELELGEGRLWKHQTLKSSWTEVWITWGPDIYHWHLKEGQSYGTKLKPMDPDANSDG